MTAIVTMKKVDSLAENVSVPSGDKKITAILLEAQSLLTKLKGRTIDYPTLVCTPTQLARLAQDDYQRATQSGRSNVVLNGDSSGQTFLANLGFDISKFEQQLVQFKAPILKGGAFVKEPRRKPDGDVSNLEKGIISTEAYYRQEWDEKVSKLVTQERSKVIFLSALTIH